MRVLVLLALVLTGCAHTQQVGRGEDLRRSAQSYLRYVRWGDLRGASGLLAPEKRASFLRARIAGKDEETLKVTDCDLDQLILEDLDHGVVFAHMSYYRLPSITEQRANIELRFANLDGAWLITQLAGGPFEVP